MSEAALYSVLGAGVAGLCAATALAERGVAVEVITPSPAGDAPPAASRLAGGMLAPDCEGESAPREIVVQGRAALEWWAARAKSYVKRGTLVVAPARDGQELDRFARATARNDPQAHQWVTPDDLEPSLKGRFARGLHYPQEAHLDPRAALEDLRAALAARGVEFRSAAPRGRVIDCRGMSAVKGASVAGGGNVAGGAVRDLRAVRGEMMLVESADITLSRPIRLLHPRFPCYIVPRGEGRFMIGATMIESARSGPITARALMELLSAAYALHPAFAEAVLLETGTGLRPAFADNLPALRFEGPDAEATQTGTDMGRIHLNGLYRHGFLMAPILAERLASQLAAGVLSYGAH